MGPLQEETTPEPLSLDGSSKHADIARLAVCDLSFTGLDQMLDREVNCFPVSVDASLMVEDEEESSLPGSMASSEERSSISNNETEVASIISDDDDPGGIPKSSRNNQHLEFTALRLTYLIVTLVIMLADGLQGTHLYVLYESYGYSVASLYCLGFVTGGLMSPVTGPLIDKFGRKKAAIVYCCLEIMINWLEQYPLLIGLIVSRMIGGVTTNLLSSVFETWLDTEFRKRGLPHDKFEMIHRDSVIVSNCAAIASGCLSHALAVKYGAVGPFKGAVTCTAIALGVVMFMWTENYGSKEGQTSKHMAEYFNEAIDAYKQDSRMLRVGIIQGFSEGSVNIFIYLWAPALALLAKNAWRDGWGLDGEKEPAYGLIFGAFMAAGVLGGILAPFIRQTMSDLLYPVDYEDELATVEVDGEIVTVRAMAVEFLTGICYVLSALLLTVPCIFTEDNAMSFSVCLASFLVFEFLMGTFRPCEGVIRSLYFPANARASIMSIPRIIVNVVVSIGVISTNFISLRIAFGAISTLMAVSAILQFSLISKHEWQNAASRVKSSFDSLCCAACRALFLLYKGPSFVCSQVVNLQFLEPHSTNMGIKSKSE